MSRPLRIEFPGAMYHVTSRGDRREDIFAGDEDRVSLLAVLGQAMERFDGQVLAYCLMSNHYHFVLHTRRANLSQVMRHVNGVYTQTFNRRHGKVGHLFQGRFKAILVDRDAYLLEVCRYVELNPVRARMVVGPGDWPWSSYLAHTGQVDSPAWLDTAGLHGYLLGRDVQNQADQQRAAQNYAALVAAGLGVALWADALRQQIYLGDEDFVARMQALVNPTQSGTVEVPRVQRQIKRTLAQWLEIGPTREQALLNAFKLSGISMTAMARELGLSISGVSRLIAKQEALMNKSEAAVK
jgi:putative transposase